MKTVKDWLIGQSTSSKGSILLLLKGYLFLLLLCFILLLLPWCHNNSNSLINHFFFAASITSTTGLIPSDFASSYNFSGQLISLIFIQLGGIGYMALSSFIILKQFQKLPKLSVNLLRLEFNLPKKYPLLQFIYSVIIFTLLIETIGAIILYISFKNAGIDQPLWSAIFHSISAFCTAGFSLYQDSMTDFKNNNMVFFTISTLSLLGSIGFIVFLDYWNMLTRKRKSITLTSKIILISTISLCVLFTLLYYFSLDNFWSLGWDGLKISLFQCISAHSTAGFNNADLSAISGVTMFTMILIMIIGASPAGTGGGIKTTTITALFAVLNSILRREKHITFLQKEIPSSNIYLAISSLLFYLTIFIFGSWLILLIEGDGIPFEKILFEAASALSTVGLSTGITSELKDFSKIIIIILMFIGRLGVLTFGFALISKSPLMRHKPKIEDIAI